MGPILVTGATGFLGGALATALARDGYEVRGQGRNAAAGAHLKAQGIEFTSVDLADDAPLPPDLCSSIATIVHCAGLSAPWGPRAAFAAANVKGTARLLEAAIRHGVAHFVLISSSSVYFRFRDQRAVIEAAPLPRPVNSYAWSKAEAERLVLAACGIKTTILRPRGLYGRGDTALLPRLLAACDRGPLPLLRGGNAVIDLTHIDDAVAAIRAVLDPVYGARSRIYNVSGGEPIAVRHIVERAAARTERSVVWKPIPWPLMLAAVRSMESLHRLRGSATEPPITAYAAGLFGFSQTLDIGLIATETGWRPTISFEDGLRRTFG